MSENNKQKTFFCWKWSQGHVECNLDNSLEKLLRKNPEKFRSMVETDQQKNSPLFRFFFLKLFLWQRNMQFWQLCQKDLARSPKKFAHCSKLLNKKFPRFFLLKKISRTIRRQFWQRRQKILARSPENFRSFSGNDEKEKISNQLFLLRMISRTLKTVLTNPPKCFEEWTKFLCSMSGKKVDLRKKKSEIIPVDT